MYGARDPLSIIEADRPRRNSRDGLLSAGSPPAEPSSGFQQHGSGRGRGARGRGRGGYFEDYHRPPGRSRSPDPNYMRRSQPSATPPPQVPAFGSASSTQSSIPATTPTIPTAPAASSSVASPVPGVVVPTAPRSLRLSQPRTFPPLQPAPNSLNIKTETFEIQPPRGPSALEIPKGPTSRPDSRFEEAADRTREPMPELSAFGIGQNIPQISPTQASVFLDRRRSSQFSSKSSEPYTPAPAQTPIFTPAFKPLAEPEQQRQRRPILGRRAPQVSDGHVGHDASDMDSDSADDFGDDYFEEEISKVKAQIAKASSVDDSELLPRPLPRSIYFLQPFIDPPVVDKDATRLLEAKEPCVPPPIETPTPRQILNDNISIVKSKAKGRVKSRPETPSNESEANGYFTTNGRGASPSSETPAPAPRPGQGKDHRVASILQPKASAPRRRGSRVIDSMAEAPPSTRSITNGKRPLMDKFEESDEEVQTEAERLESLRAVRRMMHTPPLPILPIFDTTAWHQDIEFLKSLEGNTKVSAHIKNKREIARTRRSKERTEERQRWKERYLQYRLWTDFSDDSSCVRSRDAFARKQEEDEADAAKSIAIPSITETKPESGRRTGSRFATEHDFERVLRESEREAQETKEREDRISRAKTASSKEAVIPDMAWDEDEWVETRYVDTTHRVPFERSFARLEFGEPIDNFSLEECEIFEKAYLEVPKQWGKIAESLPQRDYKACIQHYYLVKHSSNIKEKLKKQPKRRRRGVAKGAKPKSSALITDLDRAEEAENGQETDTGDRSRPRRRAAAPTFGLQESTNGEMKGASPAATPGKKSGTPKGEAGPNNEGASTTKKRPKATREKSAKQVKNSQPLAAAPTVANRPLESPATPVMSNVHDWKPRPDSAAIRFPQFDAAGNQIQPSFAPPFAAVDEPAHQVPINFDVTPSRQFAGPERLSSAPPAGVESTPPDRRTTQQTSSYWSVPEQTEFPTLLRHFGTDWHGIAKWMTSKTHIMVCRLDAWREKITKFPIRSRTTTKDRWILARVIGRLLPKKLTRNASAVNPLDLFRSL